ncbi:hsp70-binding protein 1 isoform X1 [Chelonia mydas]|uniref:hsp70-binding protein 1 isoform X1 n=1 Tax=Chelonia mydas TaxID=8469 RepID=UPI001CAA1788|nr:hsp70-binding protein 1 isoform X1 [Chelonia mydas]
MAEGGAGGNQPPREHPQNLQGLLQMAITAGNAEPSQLEPMSDERRQWLQEAMAQAFRGQLEEVEQMKECLRVLEAVSPGGDGGETSEPAEGDPSRQASALELLAELCENLDNAADFCKLDGMRLLAHRYLEHPIPELRWRAAHLVGTCAQNVPKVQEQALALGCMRKLLRLLDHDGADAVRIKALFAISCESCRGRGWGMGPVPSRGRWLSSSPKAVGGDGARDLSPRRGCWLLSGRRARGGDGARGLSPLGSAGSDLAPRQGWGWGPLGGTGFTAIEITGPHGSREARGRNPCFPLPPEAALQRGEELRALPQLRLSLPLSPAPGLVRAQEGGLQQFLRLDGFSVLMRAMQSPVEKLKVKSAFLLQNLLLDHPEHKETLCSMGMVQQLVALIRSEHSPFHEHVLGALCSLVTDFPQGVRECREPQLALEELLRERCQLLQQQEEFQEELEFCERLQRICFQTPPEDSSMDR